jgi:lipoprotein NlpD
MKSTTTLALNPRAFAHAVIYVAASLLASGCANQGWFGAPANTSYTPSNTAAPRPGVQAGYYRVNAGDTLQSVAAAFGQRVQDLAEWNHVPTMAALVPGEVLRVAPPVAANANAPGALPIRLGWPAYGQVLKSAGPGSANADHGIVIEGSANEEVKAAADGSVIFVGNGIDRYKSLIVVKHSDTLVTAYGINGDVQVNEGDAVKKGQPIAQMGADATGRSSLEFEIRREGKSIDPLAYLPR